MGGAFSRLFRPRNPGRELAAIGAAKRRATVAERTAALRRDIEAGRIAALRPRDEVVAGVRGRSA